MVLPGPLWARLETEGDISVGPWIRNHHLNHQQAAHGGMVASLPTTPWATRSARIWGLRGPVHLSVDHMTRVTKGNWLEVCSRICAVFSAIGR